MTVRVYRSTNAGAPVLSGTVSATIGMLDVLVNGIAAMAVTSVTRSGSVVNVVTTAAHGLTSAQMITIAGANETDYNGEFSVTVISPTSFTYTIATTPTTPATGVITAKIEGSGWTKPFTATNIATYRQPAGSNQFYFRVDDTGTTSARIRGFESATDATGGTGPFPTDAQISGGGYMIKSSVADASARPWVLICNGPTLYIWVNTGNISGVSTTGQMTVFGDFTSYKTADIYNTLFNSLTTASLAFGSSELNTSIGTASSGAYITRSYTQIGSSVTLSKTTDTVKTSNATSMGSAGLTYPSVVDGGLYVAPVYIGENTLSALRGVMNGIWCPCHSRPLANGDTFNGTGSLSGKLFESFNVHNTAQIFIETSNTW